MMPVIGKSALEQKLTPVSSIFTQNVTELCGLVNTEKNKVSGHTPSNWKTMGYSLTSPTPCQPIHHYNLSPFIRRQARLTCGSPACRQAGGGGLLPLTPPTFPTTHSWSFAVACVLSVYWKLVGWLFAFCFQLFNYLLIVYYRLFVDWTLVDCNLFIARYLQIGYLLSAISYLIYCRLCFVGDLWIVGCLLIGLL